MKAEPKTTLINEADETISSSDDDNIKISLKFDFDVIESAFCSGRDSRVDGMKYLILIINVSLIITSAEGLPSKISPSSTEANETIVNYKTSNSTTMKLNKETALEQRLADVL